MVWWDLSFKPQGKFRFDMLKKTREKKRPCATLKKFGVIFPQQTSNTKNAFRETLKKIEIIFPPKSQIQKMSTTTPPRSGTPPLRENSRKKEKIWENFPGMPIHKNVFRENSRKKEKKRENLKFFFQKKNKYKKCLRQPPPDLAPPPLRENSRKKEKIWENSRQFFPRIPPIQKMNSTTTPLPVPPHPIWTPPPPGPPPLPIWTPCFSICFFLKKYLRFCIFFLRFLVFLYWRYAGEKLPQIFSKLCTLLFSLFLFFKISSLNFPFLETWSFNLTIPYHNIGKKQKIFRNVWAQEFLQGLLCFCFYMFFVGVTPISSVFCIHKPSSATKLAKKEKHLVLSPLRGAFLSFKLLFRMSLPGARSRGFSSRPLFFFGDVLLQFFASFCIHKPSSATKLAKKEKHLVLSPLRGAFLSFKLLFRMSLPGARSPGFSSQPLFFLWCLTPVFSSFWIRKPSSATRIAKKKQKKHPGRTHKTTKGSQQCLGAGLCSEALFFFLGSSSIFLFLDPEAFIGY